MRCAWARTSAGVPSCPACAAANSSASGMVPHRKYERREAISKWSTLTTDVVSAIGTPNSTRYRNAGACSIACTTAPIATLKSSESPRICSYNAQSRSFSAEESDRRYERAPKVSMKDCAHASSPEAGSHPSVAA